MNTDLYGKTIAFLAAPDGTEQVELTEPWRAIEQSGGAPRLVSTAPGRIQARNHLERADTFRVDHTVEDVTEADFHALVLPGGVANPDHLRTQPRAVAFVASFFAAAKPVAAICHAPWTLIEADVVRGRTLTSWPSLRTDIHNAGGTWVDEEVKLCTAGTNVLVTSRKPDDLKAFCAEIVETFAA